MNKQSLFSLAFCAFGAFQSVLATPSIVDAIVRQNWPWSHDIVVDYRVSGTDSKQAIITLEAFNGSTSLGVIPRSAMTGCTVASSDGVKQVVIHPESVPAISGSQVLADFNVNVSCAADEGTNILYKIIDLTKTDGEGDAVVDVTDWALTNNYWGSWLASPSGCTFLFNVTNFFSPTFIWTGVTNDASYATSKLVMRRIPAGYFYMGMPDSETNQFYDDINRSYTMTKVSISRDYYMGVFELTCAQYKMINGSWPSGNDTNSLLYTNGEQFAVGGKSFNNYHGGAESVTSDSWIGRLNARTGLSFDLPTEAQWECACRAGTIGRSNDGTDSYDSQNKFSRNGVNRTTEYPCKQMPGQVGRHLPNAYGLYDTVGNVWESCRDWFDRRKRAIPVPLIDPVSPKTFDLSVNIILKGGSFKQSGAGIRPAHRYGGETLSSAADDYGIRLLLPAE